MALTGLAVLQAAHHQQRWDYPSALIWSEVTSGVKIFLRSGVKAKPKVAHWGFKLVVLHHEPGKDSLR